MKLDILVIAAHPDDAELGCGGTIAKHIAAGLHVGVVDLTRGELGTRGSVEVRKAEAIESSRILRLSVRENLNLQDGYFKNDPESQAKVIQSLRKYRPEIVLANATHDRHPDHGRGAELAFEACFYAGLAKIETEFEGAAQQAWRPKAFYHFIQSQYIQPDLIVDVSDHWSTKMNAIRAFKSQFHNPDSKEAETYISNPAFLKMVEARAVELGHSIGVKYGEGFTVRRTVGVSNMLDLI